MALTGGRTETFTCSSNAQPKREVVVGIDLGTTNSAVAAMLGNAPQIVASSDGSRTTPSVVAFDRNGAPLVGAAAQLEPGAFTSVKRFIGRKRKAISRPEEQQKEATVHAGTMAGLETVRLIREPVAAALAYGLNLRHDQTVLVLDLGGGTFDVSILEVGQGTVEVLATGGDMLLGGDDFDEVIVGWLEKQMGFKAGKRPPPPTLRRQLKRIAERAKVQLSTSESVTLRLSPPGDGAQPAGVDLGAALAGHEANRRHTKGRQRRAAMEPELCPKRRQPISQVLLVGGATRMPAFQRFVHNMTGLRPKEFVVDPDEAVALGAAVQAGILEGTVPDVMVMDVFQAGLMRVLAGQQLQEVENESEDYELDPDGKIEELSQEQAAKIDEELMGPLGFSVDQLMELAGLSVAQSVYSEYPPTSHSRVLVIAGPGNNGGDGLVAARHLYHFGYKLEVCYPKRTDKPLYSGLVTQLESLSIPFPDAEQLQQHSLAEQYDLVLDSMFGFSFRGAPRPPFDKLLEIVKPHAGPPPVVSVDSPSGWHVEKGDESGGGLRPDMLVSLTAPKLGARFFDGRFHYLGGRFVPPAIADNSKLKPPKHSASGILQGWAQMHALHLTAGTLLQDKYKLNVPRFPGTAQCVRIKPPAAGSSSAQQQAGSEKALSEMRENYSQGGLLEKDANLDPMKQFDKWFKDAVSCEAAREPNAMALATADSQGNPSVRMVLLKGYDQRGYIFYSNYDSMKAQQMKGGSTASLCFWWEPLERQVRIAGPVTQLPPEESDAYFHSRPRGSQIGAHVSHQSSVLSGREEIEAREAKFNQEFADEGKEIPRPEYWGGYLVRPETIEFWHGRPSRLHDRLQYKRDSSDPEKWIRQRLSP
eukprot:jgi/Astpho2/2329/Aster-08193